MTQDLTLNQLIDELILWRDHFAPNDKLKVILHVQKGEVTHVQLDKVELYLPAKCVTCGTWDGTAAIWVSSVPEPPEEERHEMTAFDA